MAYYANASGGKKENYMETVKNNAGWITFVVAAVLLIGLFVYNANVKTVAHDGEDHAETTTEVDQDTAENAVEAETVQATTNNTSGYQYVAQAGDSYSVLARKAVQTYGLVNKVSLSLAQIVSAETKLTVAAGSPELSEGQSVTMDAAAVKAAVEAAQKISADEAAAWEAYVPYVDFNTNAYGQAA